MLSCRQHPPPLMSKPCTSGATYTSAIICLLRPTQRLIRPAASHEVSELFRRPVMKDNVVPMPNANVLVRGTIRGMGRRGAPAASGRIHRLRVHPVDGPLRARRSPRRQLRRDHRRRLQLPRHARPSRLAASFTPSHPRIRLTLLLCVPGCRLPVPSGRNLTCNQEPPPCKFVCISEIFCFQRFSLR